MLVSSINKVVVVLLQHKENNNYNNNTSSVFLRFFTESGVTGCCKVSVQSGSGCESRHSNITKGTRTRLRPHSHDRNGEVVVVCRIDLHNQSSASLTATALPFLPQQSAGCHLSTYRPDKKDSG